VRPEKDDALWLELGHDAAGEGADVMHRSHWPASPSFLTTAARDG
jgi:hypothetical protein